MKPARRRTRLAALLVTALAAAGLMGVQPVQAATSTLVFVDRGEHFFTIPPGVTSIDVIAFGGTGRNVGTSASTIALGGAGARVSATVPVTPGSTIVASVSGLSPFSSSDTRGADLRTCSAHDAACPALGGPLDPRLVVAGGGGTAGDPLFGPVGEVLGGAGGDAGVTLAPIVSPAGSCAPASPGASVAGGGGGGGGGQCPGGGTSGAAQGVGGMPGEPGLPGFGGSGGEAAFSQGAAGGLGGGGFFGGGGGGGTSAAVPDGTATGGGGGGGGGSSFVSSVATGVTIALVPVVVNPMTGPSGFSPSVTITYTIPTGSPGGGGVGPAGPTGPPGPPGPPGHIKLKCPKGYSLQVHKVHGKKVAECKKNKPKHKKHEKHKK